MLPSGAKPPKQPIKIISIDQSYSRLGYCVQTRKEVFEVASIDLSKMKNPTQKRNCVRELVSILIRKYQPRVILVERTRIFQGGYISAKTAGMLAAMTAAIVDAAYVHTSYRKPTQVYSVDTQAWKFAVVGNRKATKQDTVKWVQQELVLRMDSSAEGLDHDAADAFCIGRYLWMAKPPKLQREK
jgi:Holliday junction resolvasome RuvABC endonuclease subunit